MACVHGSSWHMRHPAGSSGAFGWLPTPSFWEHSRLCLTYPKRADLTGRGIQQQRRCQAHHWHCDKPSEIKWENIKRVQQCKIGKPLYFVYRCSGVPLPTDISFEMFWKWTAKTVWIVQFILYTIYWPFDTFIQSCSFFCQAWWGPSLEPFPAGRMKFSLAQGKRTVPLAKSLPGRNLWDNKGWNVLIFS